MKFKFTVCDVQEIYSSACTAFISTFRYESEESDSDFENDNSDSELSDFDPDTYGCGRITRQIESRVENTWELCKPVESVFDETTSDVIKKTITTATEDSQCAGLKFFQYRPGDVKLIKICTDVYFWCCCETIQKVSPIIAEATHNLLM